MTQDKHLQCSRAFDMYFEREVTENYPYALYVCRQSCLPKYDSRADKLAKIETCRD